MISYSNLTITWSQPDLEEERWEFFKHPGKEEWYRTRGISWEMLVEAFPCGSLVPYPRSASIGIIPVALSYHTYEEYRTYLARAKRGYRKNYSRMEDSLQVDRRLTLPAPIVLIRRGEGLLFSGYRRLCLGWNYGMVPYVWRVDFEESPK